MFEADRRIGGHTHTVDVELDGQHYAVDTGFIVFNDWTYPNFIEMLDDAAGALAGQRHEFQRASMSAPGWNTTARRSTRLFAQRSNLLRPSFLGMIRDILRFHREAPALLAADAPDAGTLGEYLEREGLRPRVPGALHRAHGFGDLVGNPGAPAPYAGAVLCALFQEPRHAVGG